MEVMVLTLDYQRHGRVVAPERAGLTLIPSTPISRAFRGWSSALMRSAVTLAASHDVVHNHGLWMQVNRHARLAADASNRPLVISPRGMLEPYSRQRSNWRKGMAFALFESQNLARADLMHATSTLEASSIRAQLPSKDVVVIPNIVPAVPIDEHLTRGNSVLYLGRLDWKKGLDWLVDAWMQNLPIPGEWRLDIVGPCAIGFEFELSRLKTLTRERNDIRWAGSVDGVEKGALLSKASVVVLPSRSENFGNVVSEAMLAGRTVLTTTATPWAELGKLGIGWHVETSADGIRSGIRDILGTPMERIGVMGQQARAFAESRFAAPAIANAWLDAYELVRSKKRPDVKDPIRTGS